MIQESFQCGKMDHTKGRKVQFHRHIHRKVIEIQDLESMVVFLYMGFTIYIVPEALLVDPQ